jgi:hypothetical protein
MESEQFMQMSGVVRFRKFGSSWCERHCILWVVFSVKNLHWRIKSAGLSLILSPPSSCYFWTVMEENVHERFKRRTTSQNIKKAIPRGWECLPLKSVSVVRIKREEEVSLEFDGSTETKNIFSFFKTRSLISLSQQQLQQQSYYFENERGTSFLPILTLIFQLSCCSRDSWENHDLENHTTSIIHTQWKSRIKYQAVNSTDELSWERKQRMNFLKRMPIFISLSSSDFPPWMLLGGHAYEKINCVQWNWHKRRDRN